MAPWAGSGLVASAACPACPRGPWLRGGCISRIRRLHPGGWREAGRVPGLGGAWRLSPSPSRCWGAARLLCWWEGCGQPLAWRGSWVHAWRVLISLIPKGLGWEQHVGAPPAASTLQSAHLPARGHV